MVFLIKKIYGKKYFNTIRRLFFEDEENKKANLISELKKGEDSGFSEDFDREKFLKKIHTKFKTDQ
jgi:hypothetical protein